MSTTQTDCLLGAACATPAATATAAAKTTRPMACHLIVRTISSLAPRVQPFEQGTVPRSDGEPTIRRHEYRVLQFSEHASVAKGQISSASSTKRQSAFA